MKQFLRLLPFFLLFLLGLGFGPAAPPDYAVIALQPEALPFTPKEFYIESVQDQRPQRGAFASLLLRPDRPAVPVDLEGGTGPAIYKYISKSLKQNRSLRPIILRITVGNLTETAGPKGVINGRLNLSLAFDVRREDEQLSLITYQGNARYQRPMGQTQIVEKVIRQSVHEGLRFLNGYVNKESDNVPALASKLSVVFTNITTRTPASSDTVFYDPDRPLTWDDFRGTPPASSRYAAQIMPGVSYEGRSEVDKGNITVRLKLKVFMLKSQSWVKPIGHNDYALNHEQRHFDIARLGIENFRKRLHPDSLSLNDYNSNIQYQYIEMYRALSLRQQQYDNETGHGINQAVQARWNAQIDAELRTFGLK